MLWFLTMSTLGITLKGGHRYAKVTKHTARYEAYIASLTDFLSKASTVEIANRNTVDKLTALKT